MSGADLKRTWRVGPTATEAEVHLEAESLVGVLRALGTEQAVEARVRRTAPDAVVVRVHGRLHRAVLARRGTTLWVALDGQTYELQVQTAAGDPTRPNAARYTTSPMTGVVVQVPVASGQRVGEGDVLFVVEAMKMEYAVRAPRPLVVGTVHARPGDKVKLGDPVVSLEEVA